MELDPGSSHPIYVLAVMSLIFLILMIFYLRKTEGTVFSETVVAGDGAIFADLSEKYLV